MGTGRMGLALHKEYYEQLKLVQEDIGFQHIRGHGLFCDDMAIYQESEDGTAEYNFTYLDRVMDSYRELGLKPFLELGFMPERITSGKQTIFYWKGNTTPPTSCEAWTELVKATLEHLCRRYGREEVVTWPIEVWNEPNLPGFWEHADMQEYFKLFHQTFTAVKEENKWRECMSRWHWYWKLISGAASLFLADCCFQKDGKGIFQDVGKRGVSARPFQMPG